jgi:dephospho-CoA kinase
MLQVGLTGSIASGKSHASSVFAELGAYIIDADLIAHQLCVPGTPTFAKVVEAFGNGVLAPDGTIDRKILGEIIFHNAEKRHLLNSLVHPEVRAEVMRRMFELQKQGFQGIVIVDAALIVESGFHKMQDRLIVVVCELALQLTRVMNRCGISAEEARVRIAAQLPAEEKVKLADYVIDTSGTYSNTREQIERIHRELVLLAHRRRTAETCGD